MDTLTFNPINFRLIDGDFLSQDRFSDEVYESGGYFEDDCQLMIFVCGDLQIDIYYEIKVSGSIHEDFGDYWTPSSIEVDIDDVQVFVSSVSINEEEVELTDNLRQLFKNIVDKNLN